MLSMIWEKREFGKKKGAISKECHRDVLHICQSFRVSIDGKKIAHPSL